MGAERLDNTCTCSVFASQARRNATVARSMACRSLWTKQSWTWWSSGEAIRFFLLETACSCRPFRNASCFFPSMHVRCQYTSVAEVLSSPCLQLLRECCWRGRTAACALAERTAVRSQRCRPVGWWQHLRRAGAAFEVVLAGSVADVGAALRLDT